MDISGVLGQAASQTSRQKNGDVGLAVLEKVMAVEASTAMELINTVAQPAQEVPQEKLPLHLGRNLNVTA